MRALNVRANSLRTELTRDCSWSRSNFPVNDVLAHHRDERQRCLPIVVVDKSEGQLFGDLQTPFQGEQTIINANCLLEIGNVYVCGEKGNASELAPEFAALGGGEKGSK